MMNCPSSIYEAIPAHAWKRLMQSSDSQQVARPFIEVLVSSLDAQTSNGIPVPKASSGTDNSLMQDNKVEMAAKDTPK